jgi:hypothetical protein
MATRLPASQQTREELTALIEGRLSTASAKDELVIAEAQIDLRRVRSARHDLLSSALGNSDYESRATVVGVQAGGPLNAVSRSAAGRDSSFQTRVSNRALQTRVPAPIETRAQAEAECRLRALIELAKVLLSSFNSSRITTPAPCALAEQCAAEEVCRSAAMSNIRPRTQDRIENFYYGAQRASWVRRPLLSRHSALRIVSISAPY